MNRLSPKKVQFSLLVVCVIFTLHMFNSDFYFLQVHFENGTECMAIKELYNLLKDHRNPFMQELVTDSYQSHYREEFSSVLGMSPIHSQEVNDCGTENVVRVTLVNPSFQPSLSSALSKMIEAKLRIDNFGFNVDSLTMLTSACDEKHLSDKLTILVNDITIAMQKLHYASYRGKVYKREERSRYTYSYKCEARSFVNSLATNEHFKSRLIRDMRKVIELLADPNCELFEPLVIDYNLIEVKDGVCWSLKSRSFVENPIEERQIGKVSPRAFCAYDPAKEANPKYFREILENSLSESQVSAFCEDFLKLLNYKRKQHKDKVPCLVGDSNSGKTSLFFPIQGLVHHGNIATVTKQRAFNKAMITPFTEVIFIDEADEGVLDIADWKILTQGGYTAHDVKYQTAKAFINRCPMLVTAQRKLEFGAVHQPAMDRRLQTYYFKSLPNPKKKAAAWLKKNAMECVVWAAEKAKSCEDVAGSEVDTESDEEQSVEGEEGTLQEKEKEAIRSLSLSNPMVDEIAVSDSSDEEILDDTTVEAGTSNDALTVLRETLDRLQPESLRYRQVKQMLCEEERKRSELRTLAKRGHQSRRACLREKGINTQTADLLPTNPDSTMPTPIQRGLQEYREEERFREEQQRRETARKAFEGAWIRATEQDLKSCCDRYQASRDPSVRSNTKALMEVLCDRLKTYHQSLGTYNTTEAIQERIRVCTALGLLRKEQRHLVTSVAERLPVASFPSAETENVQEHSTGYETEEEESLYITQRPSASGAPDSSADSAVSDALLRRDNSHKKRKRLSSSQRGVKKTQSKMSEFLSQN